VTPGVRTREQLAKEEILKSEYGPFIYSNVLSIVAGSLFLTT